MDPLPQVPLPYVIGILLFLALNALFVAGEYGLLRLRFSHFNPALLDELRGNTRYRPVIENPHRAVQAMRAGILVCTLGYALVFFPVARAALGAGERAAFGVETAASALLAFILAVALHFVVAESTPRILGLAHPRRALSFALLPTVLLSWVAGPFLRAFESTAGALLRACGLSRDAVETIDSLDLEAQIEGLAGPRGDEAPSVNVTQRILKNTLRLRELLVDDVILPRKQVIYVDINLGVEENLRMVRAAGHTRYPLCDGDLDRCIGLLHIKDLFRQTGDPARLDLRKLRRDIIRIDGEETLESALAKLLAHKMHMALVIDEFRGTEGVITLERILETIVGDIRDEFDAEEEDLIQESSDPAESVVSGLALIHEIAERFGVELDDEEVSTIGGLITTRLGRIPEKGEEVRVDGLFIRVTEVDETRVIEARLRRAEDPGGADPVPDFTD
ncbi:MAG: HlyC/CorC family transporter [Opitutales bacterium]|nr:HlyC/CorC family transporter [Opitutales bacterium]